MEQRKASVRRKTTETDIEASVFLDGRGLYNIKTGIGFFDHMLEQFSKHSLFDIQLKAEGDLHIDQHHTVEDCSYALGEAISEALGERKGIQRYGHFLLPMDEALTRAAVDLSNRPFLCFKPNFKNEKIGEMECALFQEFFTGFAHSVGASIHLEVLAGENDHHKIEATFKALARCFRMAVAVDSLMEGKIPSTKGVL